MFFEALWVKIRDENVVRAKPVHIATGVCADGLKKAFGLWIELNEGVKFRLRGMNEVRHCGVKDILLPVVVGLKGFPDVIRSVFREALVPTSRDRKTVG